jgi:cell volume regulation protein A
MTIEIILLTTAILLVLSIIASTASNRLGIPALLLFLVIGMLAGSDGPGGIFFEDAALAQAVGVVALAFILFSGGLDTDWQRIKPVLGPGLALANVGVVVSMALVGGFAVLMLDFPLLEALLLGAIVSSTDAAAVFSVMQTRDVNLKGNLEPLIELESGSNDPIAVFLTIGITGLITTPDTSMLDLIPSFILQMLLGAAGGYLMGLLMTALVNRLRLAQEGLYSVLTLALVLLTYSATTAIGGNGFLAVYLAGIVMGNRKFIHKRSLLRFHEGVAWLMQIGMFLTLGLLVYPSRLLPVIGGGLLISVFLIAVARPVSVFFALAFARMSVSEKLMISWSGLRGAVPIVLATFPLLAGVPRADLIFNLVFFIVLTSVLIQGVSIQWMARMLGVNTGTPSERHYPLEFIPDVNASSRLSELPIPAGAVSVGKSIMQLALPRGALVIVVRRGQETIIADGSTILEAGDRLLLLAKPEALTEVRATLGLPAASIRMVEPKMSLMARVRWHVVNGLRTRRTTDDGRRTTDDEQRTTNRGRRTEDDGRAKTDHRPPTIDERPPTTDE